jgi:hypothetical protein
MGQTKAQGRGVHGRAEEVALRGAAADGAQDVRLDLALDAEGQDFEPQVAPQADDGAGDGLVAGAAANVADKGTGNLESIAGSRQRPCRSGAARSRRRWRTNKQFPNAARIA